MFHLGFKATTSRSAVLYPTNCTNEWMVDNLQIQCGNYYCHDGFYCYSGSCRPIRSCGAHDHCPADQYCDIHLQACRKGVRRCYTDRQCGYGNICKGGICNKRECRRHRDCPGNQACHYPGICRDYEAYCYEGYPGYCKDGYVCVASEFAHFDLSLRYIDFYIIL